MPHHWWALPRRQYHSLLHSIAPRLQGEVLQQRRAYGLPFASNRAGMDHSHTYHQESYESIPGIAYLWRLEMGDSYAFPSRGIGG